MKISKRSLLIVVSLMLALTTAALGTVAYMTSRDTVVNTFTVGNINIIVDEEDVDGSKEGFVTPGTSSQPATYPETVVDVNGDGIGDKIVVDSNGDITITFGDNTPEDLADDKIVVITPGANGGRVDLDGDTVPDVKVEVGADGTITITPIDPTTGDLVTDKAIVITPTTPSVPSQADRDQKNAYKLIPGKTYTKDPTVTVKAGSEECYVRMVAKMNCYGVLSTITQKTGVDLLKEFVGEIDAVWQLQGNGTVVGDEITYEFRYVGNPEKVSAATGDVVLPPLFKTITTPGYFTGAHLSSLGQMFKIDVEGHAIQTESFADANAAWAAFAGQYGN